MLENMPCMNEVESVLLQFVLGNVVTTHLNIGRADRDEKLSFNIAVATT